MKMINILITATLTQGAKIVEHKYIQTNKQEICDYEDVQTQALLRVHLFSWSD